MQDSPQLSQLSGYTLEVLNGLCFQLKAAIFFIILLYRIIPRDFIIL